MKKRVITILITIIVILFGVLAFILGADTNLKSSKESSPSIKTTALTSKKSISQQQVSQASVSVSSSKSSGLNATNLTPKQVAALVAYHGSTLNNDDWQAWSNYESAMEDGQSSTNEIFVLTPSQCPVKVSQSGTGKVYSYTDQGGTLNFYTLSGDGKTVYIYDCDSEDDSDSDDVQQPIETVTLQDMVNQANSDSMAKEIMNVANSINVKDCE